ncbi:hypothetical protein K438DRAFT_1748453 [Mycena galopus ATCC 62051]|nr:hypothetical protein K438DRAFT_1748453 [Mycena galopus ATCC 62051]
MQRRAAGAAEAERGTGCEASPLGGAQVRGIGMEIGEIEDEAKLFRRNLPRGANGDIWTFHEPMGQQALQDEDAEHEGEFSASYSGKPTLSIDIGLDYNAFPKFVQMVLDAGRIVEFDSPKELLKIKDGKLHGGSGSIFVAFNTLAMQLIESLEEAISGYFCRAFSGIFKISNINAILKCG